MVKRFELFSLVIFSGIFFLSGCSFGASNIYEIKIDNKKENQKIEKELPIRDKKEMSILFLGDLMFDRSIRQFAQKKGNDFIFEKVADLLKDNDLAVVNLEGPITDNQSKSVNTVPEQKEHFYFTFDKSLAETLAKNNIKLVNLGNNHTLNFGQEGLVQTENYLKENNVDYFGDPVNKEKNYIFKEINGMIIGFVSYNQFGGSAEETINNINNIKNKVDTLIVYTHWGKEYEKIFSEKIKSLAHSFVDSGADLIIGSHPHVVQDIEEYKGKRIYYSLGNFIFDQYFSAETMSGLAVRVKVNPDDKSLEFQEIPLVMNKSGQVLPK